MIKQFLVTIDIDKDFNVVELEHMIEDKLDNCDHTWISLNVIGYG